MNSRWIVSVDADGWWVVVGDRRHGPFPTERGATATARALVDLSPALRDDERERARADDTIVVVLGFILAAIVALIVGALVMS